MAARLLLVLLVVGGTLAAGGAALGRRPFTSAAPHIALSSLRPLYSIAGASPGDRTTGSVRVTNDGRGRGRFALNATTTGSAALARDLRVEVLEDGRRLYNGSLGWFRRVDLGVIAPGDARRVTVRVSLPRDASTQGRRVNTSFTWSAVSA